MMRGREKRREMIVVLKLEYLKEILRKKKRVRKKMIKKRKERPLKLKMVRVR